MKIVCSWCNNPMGEKAPFDNPSVTHAICAKCSSKQLEYKHKVAAMKENPYRKEAIYNTEVASGLISNIEIQQSQRGYYIYYKYIDGDLTPMAGPYKKLSTALKHVQTNKKALEA